MAKLINLSTIGADHIRDETPCQDFGGILERENCHIFATADGHGSSSCTRSDIGSKNAVGCALACLEEFHSQMEEEGLVEGFLQNPNDASMRIEHLILSIISYWRIAAEEDFQQHPLSESERNLSQKYLADYEKGHRIERLYGTTLIAGLLTDRYLLLLQQGDGRCVVFDEKGVVSQPIPWDDTCFLNVTTSLCDQDAIERFRYHLINLEDKKIVACFASSDGVEDSFPNLELMESYFRSQLLSISEAGFDEHLEEWSNSLPTFSSEGSRDDVTITGFIDVGSIHSLSEEFERENRIVNLNAQLLEVHKRLKSMDGMNKYSLLTKRLDEKQTHLESLQSKLLELEEEKESYTNELQSFLQEIENKLNVNLSNLASYTLPLISPIKTSVLKAKHVMEDRKEKLSLEKETLTEQIQILTTDIDKLKEEIDIIVDRRVSLESEQDALRIEIDALTSSD